MEFFSSFGNSFFEEKKITIQTFVLFLDFIYSISVYIQLHSIV